tara:strand:+ start:15927 stop:16220 length:294 start_codon:yes stop_codon:yes gene_type:complete
MSHRHNNPAHRIDCSLHGTLLAHDYFAPCDTAGPSALAILSDKLLDLLSDEHVNGIDHGAVHNGTSLSCRNLVCSEMRRVRATLQASATVEIETAQT